ncbi:iron complex transport system substrate-binding protein [Pseudomonas flavescens]|uniref:Iron complex transport system substrate-binding protein n=1 Tax=Phytopseudomonas flavescens TaxID=29435 RepID=A0A1G8CTV9_9GAMM|nr:ABC transporter substrate-binding protein [Pseudomonas flavescens]SDH48925.1 iron complex transport system substrate-binding protein [Pseudomonas flavescens]
MKGLLRAVSLLLCLVSGLSGAQPRVIALSWEAAEHLLKLQITPIAVADAEDYRTWVVRPALPDAVPSAGSRTEPNLELLAQLKPELIVIPPLLEDIRGKLERIAPVAVYSSFSQQHDNYLAARDNYLALAQRFGREDQALRELAAMQARVDELHRRLVEHFRGRLPKVAVIRFSSTTAVFINGANSMADHAMQLLHLQPAYPLPRSPWGIVQVPVTTLGRIDDGVILHIEPFAGQEQLFATPLWKAMPFVRDGRFAAMRSTWTYGGVFSIEYLAEAITEALLRLPAR